MKKNEAKKRKKKIMLISTLATAALIIGGLTFAWYTSKDSVTNTFKTSGNLKTVVVENFTPPTNWQPGVTTDKVVQVTNTGTVDAYTRVRLDEVLTYYKKKSDTPVLLSDSVPDSKKTYVKVDAEAIEKTVTNWNADEANKDQQYLPISDVFPDASVPSGAVIYVKKSLANSKDSDTHVVEHGNNYDFIGYYDTGEVTKDVEGSDGNDKKICYELSIVPTITDTQSPSDGSANAETDIEHTLSVELECGIYEAEEVVVPNDSTEISKYIELEFNTKGASSESDWYFCDGWYYYRGVLASGQSTSALLKAVRFKENAPNDIINATYDLTVVSESTQAVKEAFETWAPEATAAAADEDADTATTATTPKFSYETIITNLTAENTKSHPTNIATTSKSKCAYSTIADNNAVCSDNLADMLKGYRTHETDSAVTNARKTTPSGEAVTGTTSEKKNETNSAEVSSGPNNGGQDESAVEDLDDSGYED